MVKQYLTAVLPGRAAAPCCGLSGGSHGFAVGGCRASAAQFWFQSAAGEAVMCAGEAAHQIFTQGHRLQADAHMECMEAWDKIDVQRALWLAPVATV